MSRTLILIPILAILFSYLLCEDIPTDQIRFDPETGEIVKDKNEQSNLDEKISAYNYL